MAKEIRINTKYARRDVQRMQNAVASLKAAQNLYNNILSSTEWQGIAGNEFRHLIDERIKGKKFGTESMIKQLEESIRNLTKVINEYEAKNDELLKIFK